ncbi:MAG TPA: GGDEF domain-containing protein, partial [Treponemataceae bacterium]|nr:GGDEF domain-containing protein [Treponemataceae bacterium]
QHFAVILADGMRLEDLASRYGGEEFMIFMNNATEETALSIVERIRVDLEKSTIDYKGQNIPLRVSAGVYAASESISLPDAILKSDEALYKAKESGRNRTIVWTLAV